MLKYVAQGGNKVTAPIARQIGIYFTTVQLYYQNHLTGTRNKIIADIGTEPHYCLPHPRLFQGWKHIAIHPIIRSSMQLGTFFLASGCKGGPTLGRR